ncbi:MAG: hypothetical protein ACJAVF_002783, partial [Paraglaciecola sp.]
LFSYLDLAGNLRTVFEVDKVANLSLC